MRSPGEEPSVRVALAIGGIDVLRAEARQDGPVARALGRVRRSAAAGAAVSDGPPLEEPGAAGTSFEPLFRTHEPDVRRLCRRMLGEQAARDAAHEVYLRAQRGFGSWDPQRPFRRWLLAVTGNYCVDQLRRRSREARLFDASDLEAGDLLDPGPSPLRQALHAEERVRLLEAIDALPQKYRVPLVLRYFEELDYDGIGDVLGLGRGQVGSLLFRARRRLREALAPGGDSR
jgi:RNA polymerase sigma-70 factor (ECF subfamily)